MSAQMNCPTCGRRATGEAPVSAGFSGIKPGSPPPEPYPVAYAFECQNPKCGHKWTAPPEDVDVQSV